MQKFFLLLFLYLLTGCSDPFLYDGVNAWEEFLGGSFWVWVNIGAFVLFFFAPFYIIDKHERVEDYSERYGRGFVRYTFWNDGGSIKRVIIGSIWFIFLC